MFWMKDVSRQDVFSAIGILKPKYYLWMETILFASYRVGM